MSGFVECRHTLHNGHKCQSPALRGKPFCRHHAKLHLRTPVPRRPGRQVRPAIDDINGLQTAVARALTALASPFTDVRRAGLLLYGLNIAARLIRCAPATISGDVLRQSHKPKCSPLALTPNH